MSETVLRRQEIVEQIEAVINQRGPPPRSTLEVIGTDDDGRGGGDWIFNGFKKAYEEFQKPVPEDYLPGQPSTFRSCTIC